MVDSPNTTTLPRVAFSSAVAVRTRHSTPLPAVQLSHQALMAALAQEQPHAIIGTYAADRFDIEERANHLNTVLVAVATYAKAIIADTAELAPIGYIRTGNVGLLEDAASDINSALMDCVDRMIDDQAEVAA